MVNCIPSVLPFISKCAIFALSNHHAMANKNEKSRSIPCRQSDNLELDSDLVQDLACEPLILLQTVPSESVIETSGDLIHYMVMSMGMFARRFKLTRREACNYLARFKGLEFSIRNYEVEHQLSLQECVDDMAAICRKNGGII